ncbi:MAG: 16S rRNA (guanine(527)-N(7))-methyltransferase RsmG [Chloroflexota bacterium]
MRPSEPPHREPLPRQAAGLPSLGAEAAEVLGAGVREMGLQLSPDVLAGIDSHARLLDAWGRHVNLTAIREPVAVMRLHVLDSLAAVAPIRARIPGARSLVDIGSGGGYPGIPLGLAMGVARLSLVESVGRKARFLEVAGAEAAAALGGTAPAVEVLPERSEAVAAGSRRATWDVATVRAVGDVAECAELGLPLVRVGGWLVCWKREREEATREASLQAEVDAARALVGRLGGGSPEVIAAGVPGAPGHRLVLIHKERPTPAMFPRSTVARRPGRDRATPRVGGETARS